MSVFAQSIIFLLNLSKKHRTIANRNWKGCFHPFPRDWMTFVLVEKQNNQIDNPLFSSDNAAANMT
jgi:hypothetical protein